MAAFTQYALGGTQANYARPFTNKSAGGVAGQVPRASKYRSAYRVNTVTGRLVGWIAVLLDVWSWK